MKSYEFFGIYDFTEIAEELTTEELIQVNGGCGFFTITGQVGQACGGTPGCTSTPPGCTRNTPPSTPGCGDNHPPSNPMCGNNPPPRINNDDKQKNDKADTNPPVDKKKETQLLIKKIIDSITSNWKKQYNYDTGYRCDNWVEEVLDDADFKSSDYLKAGKAKDKTVQEHIDKLKKDGKEGVDYTTTLPTEDGVYVVLMDDGTFSNGEHAGEHAGLVVVEDGKATLYDNSSGNGGNPVYKKDDKGNKIVSYYDQGVGKTDITGINGGKKIEGFVYDTYYYEKVK